MIKLMQTSYSEKIFMIFRTDYKSCRSSDLTIALEKGAWKHSSSLAKLNIKNKMHN